MLCGMQEFDVDDWMRNTIYRTYTKTSKQVNIEATQVVFLKTDSIVLDFCYITNKHKLWVT